MSDSELPILKVSIPVSSTRRFTLLDAIILMAATAAGLALLGMYLAQGWFFGGAFFYGRFEILRLERNRSGLPVSDLVDLCPGDSPATAAEATNPQVGAAAGDGGLYAPHR